MSQISYRQLLSACLSAARDCSVVIRNTYAEGGNKVYLNKSTDPNVIGMFIHFFFTLGILLK